MAPPRSPAYTHIQATVHGKSTCCMHRPWLARSGAIGPVGAMLGGCCAALLQECLVDGMEDVRLSAYLVGVAQSAKRGNKEDEDVRPDPCLAGSRMSKTTLSMFFTLLLLHCCVCAVA